MIRVVIDTNILVSALLTTGANRQVIRTCLMGQMRPLIGSALFLEYEDLLARQDLYRKSLLINADERRELFAAFLSVCEWVQVYYLWRPNPNWGGGGDEGDNHLIELAVAGGASFLATNNLRDLKSGELRFPSIRIVSPKELLEEL